MSEKNIHKPDDITSDNNNDITSEIILDWQQIQQIKKLLSWSDIFGNNNPVEIEVGSGKGTFIVNQSRKHPEVNYLGIEWANKFYKYSVDRVRRWGLSNVRLLRADAREFIAKYVSDASVRVFHIYFPDPWPKRRHNRRRFFQEDNILQVIRCLKKNGQLRLATDHKEYFDSIETVLLGNKRIADCFEQIEFLPVDAADDGEWVGSNFERKYLKEGRPIYTLALRKV